MSYLSENVYDVVYRIPNSLQKKRKLDKCLNAGGSSILNSLEEYFSKKAVDVGSRESYFEIVRFIWNRDNLQEESTDNTKQSSATYNVTWTSAAPDIDVCLQEMTDAYKANLIILKLTTILERSLGDLFLSVSKSKTCPSLLKDLLNTRELEQVFGEKYILILKTLVGRPDGLNLRNVLWHGFPMMGEIPSKYCICLIELISALGKVLQDKKLTVIHRPKLDMRRKGDFKNILPLISLEDKECIMKLFKSTAFIPIGMLPSWKLVVELFLQKRYSDAVVILLPQLEHALRCLFTVVNECPQRQQTAESSVFYTTFDEILAKEVTECRTNNLIAEIGNNLTELLFDLLFFPEGLRLRDCVSHGEYRLADIDETVANHVICIGLCLCLKYIFPWREYLADQNKLFKRLKTQISCYRSVSHPIPLLVEETKLCMESLKRLEDAHCAINHHLEENEQEDYTRLEDSYLGTSRLYFLTMIPIKFEIAFASGLALIDQCVRQIGEIPREVLFRPKKEIEINRILRKIVQQCSITTEQLMATLETKKMENEQRTSRSRARKNFRNMIAVVPKLLLFCYFMLLVVAVESFASTQSESSTTETASTSRFLKRCLKLAENMASLTSPSKNRWFESSQIVTSMLGLAKDRIARNNKDSAGRDT